MALDTVPAFAPEPAPRMSTTAAGKYLCLQLREEVYGLPILDVREIIGVIPIVPLPRSPPAVRGVVNLRGKVIPVLDLRVRFGFGFDAGVIGEQSVIIVVQCLADGQPTTVGLLVDQVLEVVRVDQEQIEPPPAVALDGASFLLGVAKTQSRVVFLLESARLIGGGSSPAA